MKKKILFTITPVIISLFIWQCSTIPNEHKEAAQQKQNNKPNIIYILADDLGYNDLSCYGQQNFKTPNIDKLAEEGMMFTQHYSGSSVCAPSRSALMTGMHTGHTYIRGNKEIMPEGQHPLPADLITIPKLLKENGYVTGAFGKWGLGYPGSSGDPLNQGFDHFYGYNCQRLGHHYYPYHLWDNDQKVVLEENDGQKTGVYGPAVIHDKTLEFIEKNKDTSFFLYVPSIIPHAELFAPDSLVKKYSGKFLPEKEYKGCDGGEGYRIGKYGSQHESHAAFVAMIDLLDQQVGEIMAKLKELKLDENTIVIFASDNGPHQEGGADPDYFDSNGPLRGYKRALFEGGIRVPMIVWWPEKVKSGKTDHISAFWDVLPTVLDITGTKDTVSCDGISFLPTLLGEKQKEHEYLYWEFHEQGGRQAVRMKNWKGVRLGVLKDSNAPVQLFDLSTDIGEKNNIANQHPEIVKQMEKIMVEARTASSIFLFNQIEQ